MKMRLVPGIWGKLPEYLTAHGGSIEKTAESILREMTLKEKIAQMDGDQPLVRGLLEMMTRYNREPIPGGENFRLGVPGIRFSDGPRGVAMYRSTCFPCSMARGAGWDIDLEERIGAAMGIEARVQGANFLGSVCINLLRHPAWGRAQETYGEDPLLLGEMGAAAVRGIQRHVMACVKHFACNSLENTRFKIDVSIDERTLRELYLPHFKRCVDEGAASVMSAYNKVNGRYCGENPYLLTDILRGEWGFRGIVVSDFVFGLYDGRKGVEAGLDIEMPFRRAYGKKLKTLVESGAVDEALVDSAVKRILELKLRFAAENRDEREYTRDKLVSSEHTALAKEAAEKSMVLLKNTGSLLPLDCRKPLEIAVVGSLAGRSNIGDRGSSSVHPPYAVSPLEGLRTYIRGRGVETPPRIRTYPGSDPRKAAALAKEADICIVVTGYTWRDEGERMMNRGGDRTSLRLPEKEETYIRAVTEVQPRTVVVIESGSAVIMEPWINGAAAVIMAWYPGMEGGNALAEILFGAVNPSGKLPFAVPKREEDLPFFDPAALAIRYEYYHGYRKLQKEGIEPAFPFGFGLSYTEYTYSDARLDRKQYNRDDSALLTVTVMNTGPRAGSEIIQVYASQLQPTVDRPRMELCAFRRVHLAAGEKKTVEFTIPMNRLAYFEAESNSWKTDSGEYAFFTGGSSEISGLLETRFSVR